MRIPAARRRRGPGGPAAAGARRPGGGGGPAARGRWPGRGPVVAWARSGGGPAAAPDPDQRPINRPGRGSVRELVALAAAR